jgi:hypothetical protein
MLALLVAACGKEAALGSVAPAAGVYHLEGREGVTALELRHDGTFTIHHDSCVSAGVLECGSWNARSVVPQDGLYWPTPPAFPSTVFRRITLHGDEGGDLVVVGESPWAGSFAQRWKRGRVCQTCDGQIASVACDAPLPACTPR